MTAHGTSRHPARRAARKAATLTALARAAAGATPAGSPAPRSRTPPYARLGSPRPARKERVITRWHTLLVVLPVLLLAVIWGGWEPTPQPARSPHVTCGCPVQAITHWQRSRSRRESRSRSAWLAGSYTGTGLATPAPVLSLPRAFRLSAMAWRMAPAEREFQRSVHVRMSRQYQRRSRQALPPSATIWSADKRVPHIQQDLTVARSAGNGAGRC
jgi:hypothetical protein